MTKFAKDNGIKAVGWTSNRPILKAAKMRRNSECTRLNDCIKHIPARLAKQLIKLTEILNALRGVGTAEGSKRLEEAGGAFKKVFQI